MAIIMSRNLFWAGMEESGMSDGVGNLGLPSLLLAALLLVAASWPGEVQAVNGQCTSPFVATGAITADSGLYQPGGTSGPTSFSTTGTATCNCTGISVGLLMTVYYREPPACLPSPILWGPLSSSTPISASRSSSMRQGDIRKFPSAPPPVGC